MPIGLRPPYRLGHGFALLLPEEVSVDDSSLDVLVKLELDIEDGRVVVSRFCAERRPGGPPITMDILKSVPLVRLRTFAANTGLLTGLVRISTTDGTHTVRPATAEDVAALTALPELDRVAIVYRAALFYGYPPTVKVAEALDVSPSVAAKRVQAARRAGLLEPTTPGRKGA